MKNLSLSDLAEKLKSSPRVKGIFTTGSTAGKMSPSSDIDIVVVLDRNSEKIKSIYTLIENRLADIFFLDFGFVARLKNKKVVSANDLEGMVVEWLAHGKIEYDPTGALFTLKAKIDEEPPRQRIHDSEKRDLWIKVNYNFIANFRHHNSPDEIYHQALELRLLYSVIELVVAYFSFRDIPWRGEKAAVKYLKQNDAVFFSALLAWLESSDRNEKMNHYQRLFEMVFFGKYQKWPDDFIVPLSDHNRDEEELISFWQAITR